jgi:hypothetical protein
VTEEQGTDRPEALNPITWLMRVHGLSKEDAINVCDKLFALAEENLAMHANLAPPPDPLRTMTTTEGVGDAMVVRTWVNVESLTETLVDQVTTMVADQLIRTLATANKEMGHAGST